MHCGECTLGGGHPLSDRHIGTRVGKLLRKYAHECIEHVR